MAMIRFMINKNKNKNLERRYATVLETLYNQRRM